MAERDSPMAGGDSPMDSLVAKGICSMAERDSPVAGGDSGMAGDSFMAKGDSTVCFAGVDSESCAGSFSALPLLLSFRTSLHSFARSASPPWSS